MAVNDTKIFCQKYSIHSKLFISIIKAKKLHALRLEYLNCFIIFSNVLVETNFNVQSWFGLIVKMYLVEAHTIGCSYP